MAPTFNAIGLTVADMAATLAFYRKLGLDIPADADTAPHVDVPLSGGIRLMFDTYDTIHSFDPDWTPATGGPQFGLGFECADPAEVDTTYTEMTKAGYDGHKEPWDAPWGQRYAALHDPDGNGVDLYAPLPTS
jgi:catechol 2,3-dioxygenase-like lactoylglutathione lyase family enzyme